MICKLWVITHIGVKRKKWNWKLTNESKQMFANIYQTEARYLLKLQKMKPRKKVSSVIKKIKKEMENLFNTWRLYYKKSIKSKSREYPREKKIIVLTKTGACKMTLKCNRTHNLGEWHESLCCTVFKPRDIKSHKSSSFPFTSVREISFAIWMVYKIEIK